MSDVFRFTITEGFLGNELPYCSMDDVTYVAVIPFVGMVTKLERVAATNKFNHLLRTYTDDFKDLQYYKFRGMPQQTPVANVQTIIRILMLLSGPAAARFRLGAAQELVRFMGFPFYIL